MGVSRESQARVLRVARYWIRRWRSIMLLAKGR